MVYGTGASETERPFCLELAVAKFTYGDTVRVISAAPESLRPDAVASVVGITEEPRTGSHFEQFPPGAVFLVEYEDGVAVDIHESHLELLK